MTQQTEGPIGGLTRRRALRSGVALSTGLVFGGFASGTAAATAMATSRAVPIHLALRAMGDSEPSPRPDPQDKLVHRFSGNPVDDGTDHEELDGSHQLKWGEFRALEGRARMECVEDGDVVETAVSLAVKGLVPGGLYTVWVCEFENPGFVDSRDPGWHSRTLWVATRSGRTMAPITCSALPVERARSTSPTWPEHTQ